jgi:hypothetical protein
MPFVPSGNYVNQFQEKINIKDMPRGHMEPHRKKKGALKASVVVKAGESLCSLVRV